MKEVTKTVKAKTDKDVKDDKGVKDVKKEEPWYAEDTVKKETAIKFESKINKNQDLAKNLKGHLMLVTGDIDNNVHPGNTLRVADALIQAGKRFDFMIMPGQRHGYGTCTKYFDRVMWYYFAQHLLGDTRTNVEIYLPDEK